MVGVRSTIHQVLRAKGYDPVPLDPWYFPTPRAYRALLEGAGFIVNSCGESHLLHISFSETHAMI